VGCIFGELLTQKPLFPGKSEIDQINKVFKVRMEARPSICCGCWALLWLCRHHQEQLRMRVRVGGLRSQNGLFFFDGTGV
jgi:hypothetical protein